MKTIKLLFLSLFVLLFFQQISYAQINGINTQGNDAVCVGSYPYTFNGTATVTSVTVNPSSAGNVVPFTTTDNGVLISWNNSLTSATITVNYTYIAQVWTIGGCTQSDGKTKYDCNVSTPTTGSITSLAITLKKPTGYISGPPSIICTNANAVSYTVNDAPEVLSWGYPSNGNGSWTQASPTALTTTFYPNAGVSGDLIATIRNSSCNSSTSNISYTVQRPSIAPTITSPTGTVNSNTPISFTVSPIPGATSYSWTATVNGNSNFSVVSQSVTINPSTSINFSYSASYIVTTGYTTNDTKCPARSSQTTINVTCPEPDNVTPCGTTQLISIPNSPTGFSTDQFPRFVQDVTGDPYADILMFTTNGAYLAKANPNGSGTFLPLTLVSTYWAITSSWPNQSTTPRFLADVDGVNGPDIVGIAANGIFVSLNNGSGGFGVPAVWSTNGGINTGWVNQDATYRLFAYLNGDNRADLIGFGSGGTFVMYAKATGIGFQAPVVLANCAYFSNSAYPSNQINPRFIKDMDGVNGLDIVIFGLDGVWVSTQKADHTFNPPVKWINDFGSNQGYPDHATTPRMLVNMDNNGGVDVIGFGSAFVRVAINNGGGLNSATNWSEGYTAYANNGNQNSNYVNMDVNPRLVGDINGDNLPDLIGFKQTFVAISKNTGNGFSCPDYEYKGPNGVGGAYTGAVGYTSQTYFPRYLANIDSDSRMEIVGFYTNKVEATICNSSYFRQGVDDVDATASSNLLTCYPNPASDAINFKISKMNGSAHIVIYDGTGSKVKEITNEDLASGSYTLNTSGLLNGVYYYQYADGSGNIKSDKFIIMK